MPNLTPNYSFNMPLVNNATDADLWGGQLNSNWSGIDTELKAVSDTADSGILPVGSIYMNYSDSTNPGTLLGYGTWVAITDKFVVARGATYTGTGGAATVTLSEANLPSSVTIDMTSVGAVDNSVTGNQKIAASASGARTMAYTVSLGSGTAFDILPPYQVVYMWYRSA